MGAIFCGTFECIISCNLEKILSFDSRQDVTKRLECHHHLCTKIAMMFKAKTEVNFKSSNLAVRARYVGVPLFGYTAMKNSFILLHNRISATII
jgi:hypothetical protein